MPVGPRPVTTKSGSDLLLQKDEIINQLRLESAGANSELAKTHKKLLDTECALSEARKHLPKPLSTSQVYKAGVEAAKKTRRTLLDRVHAINPNSDEITTDTFAKASVHHLDTVRALEKMKNGLISAWALMMLIAETCWCNPAKTTKMCGFGDSEEPSWLDRQGTHGRRETKRCRCWRLGSGCVEASHARQFQLERVWCV
jgi:hypothetical protein